MSRGAKWPKDRSLEILIAWYKAGTVKGAAAVMGISEQSAKNALQRLRDTSHCASNDELLQWWSRTIGNARYGYLEPGEARRFRYRIDEEYRERMRRQAREAMRRKRAADSARLRTNYDQLVEVQGDKCAICGQPETRRGYAGDRTHRLSVDHDHETGQVRELLCKACNAMLGCARDIPERLEAGAAYLRKHGKTTSHNSGRKAA